MSFTHLSPMDKGGSLSEHGEELVKPCVCSSLVLTKNLKCFEKKKGVCWSVTHSLTLQDWCQSSGLKTALHSPNAC